MRNSFCSAVALLFLAGCFPQDKNPGSGGNANGSGGQANALGGNRGNGGGGGGSRVVGSGGAAGSGGSSMVSGGSGGSNSGGNTSSTRSDAATSQGGQGGGGGSAGSGGTSQRDAGPAGGASGTGGSTAPTPCNFSSDWTVGGATYTYYSLPNPITACGYNGSNNTIKNIVNGANFAAIPGTSSSDFNTSNRCGACIQIGSAIVTIVDECPYDGNNNPPCKANPSGHMDLSEAATNAGGVKGDPAVQGQNQWKYVPCPVTGNVVVRLKPGNNNEMFIENEILPIASVTCDGKTGSRTSYGAWHFGSNIPGAICDVTDIAGRKISVTAGSTQGQDVDTHVQFPKCQ
jgi:hypothetical protein